MALKTQTQYRAVHAIHSAVNGKQQRIAPGEYCTFADDKEAERLLRLNAVEVVGGSKTPIQVGDAKPAAPDAKVEHVFAFSAADLKGKTLDQLNALIIEKDPSITPFDNIATAKAFLMKDAD